jgi:hypothetical protein
MNTLNPLEVLAEMEYHVGEFKRLVSTLPPQAQIVMAPTIAADEAEIAQLRSFHGLPAVGSSPAP